MDSSAISSRLRKVLYWLHLGDSAAARRELSQIEPQWSDFPRIIKLKWCICAAENEWEKALDWGRFLKRAIPQDPIAWIQEAEALNALNRTEEAWETLLPSAHVFKTQAAIPYLLACYSGRLGYIHSAKQWLRKAVEINPSIRVTFSIYNEPDLGCVFSASSSPLNPGWAGLEKN